MQGQEFEHAVAATVREQAQRLREFGFSAAAAEVDAHWPGPITEIQESLLGETS